MRISWKPGSPQANSVSLWAQWAQVSGVQHSSCDSNVCPGIRIIDLCQKPGLWGRKGQMPGNTCHLIRAFKADQVAQASSWCCPFLCVWVPAAPGVPVSPQALYLGIAQTPCSPSGNNHEAVWDPVRCPGLPHTHSTSTPSQWLAGRNSSQTEVGLSLLNEPRFTELCCSETLGLFPGWVRRM